MSKFISYKVNDRGICFVELNRSPVNALSFYFLKSIQETFSSINNNKSIKVVILKSSLPHFSAGADLKERKIMSKKDANKALDNFNNCFSTIENLNQPTICLINGYCLGGGAELSLAFDFRIASDDALIGFPEVSIGIIPGAGGTYRLPKLIGFSNAKYWILTAKKFNSDEAKEFGFLNFSTSKNDLESFAVKLASDIIANAPIAIKSAKRAINESFNCKVDDGLKIERDNYKIALNTKDRDEALNAFIEKRKPKWNNE